MSESIKGRHAENCQPPLGISPEVSEYLKGLQPGERVVECGESMLTGHCGTVYVKVESGPGPSPSPSTDKRTVCVRWDPRDGQSHGTSATWGTRRLKDAGTFSHLDEPEVSDGCDKDGFPGGCERAGHQVVNCPGIMIGDTVAFNDKHHAAGSSGVVVAEEVWLDDHKTLAWNGVGERPVYKGAFTTPNVQRFLIRLMTVFYKNLDTTSTEWWRDRCLQSPHNYPWVVERELHLLSRPEIKKLNDSGCLGSVIGRDKEFTCISDSEAGARWRLAEMKAAMLCFPILPGPPSGRESAEGIDYRGVMLQDSVKVADVLEIGFKFYASDMCGKPVTYEVVEIDETGQSAKVDAGGHIRYLTKLEDGWHLQNILVDKRSIQKVTVTE